MDGSISAGDALPWQPWKNISAEMLGRVLGNMPSLADRVRARSVCRSWRDAAATQRLPLPLPMLVFSRFSFACFASFSPTMEITEFSSIPLCKDATIFWVGSFDEWLVGMRRSSERKADGHCFLVNAFSRETIRLPHPRAFHLLGHSCKALPIVNTSHPIHINVHAPEYPIHFRKVILSAPPASGAMCIVAAISHNTLALWHPGMSSWSVCRSIRINVSADIAFYQGRIYMVSANPTGLLILFFELEEVDDRVTVSYAEQCVTEPLPLVKGCLVHQCCIVEWHGKLVLIIMFADCDVLKITIRKIGIYPLDFSTNPHSFTEINSLDGDCLFISSCSSKSFPACQYDGANGDFVYFVSNYNQQTTSSDPSFDVLVYNVRDAKMIEFPVLVPKDNSWPFLDNLLWLFPPK
ncbi:uncharacterized protein LOC102711484 [Oryza brachyantha]|uniref:KIB1-4 beta-propeller domain-containing protein n=1 Tax=Oryza brachyantha TaxID=4533 RepID=J3N9E5_ORYBR|nr:uncharacterized protein LOC102711484 [Oryza brachyantha]